MQMLKIIIFILLVILVVIFVFQNPWIIEKEVYITIPLYYTFKIALWIILLIFFFLGTLLSTCCYIVKHSKLKRLLNQNKKRIIQMERELVSLRNLPITEDQEEKTSSLQTT
jgi:uncharacterized integral membrane protein